ncbi:unnamed protein product [Colias eurytheme]|nr:unnamed protein product [Colias eurytheme]
MYHHEDNAVQLTIHNKLLVQQKVAYSRVQVRRKAGKALPHLEGWFSIVAIRVRKHGPDKFSIQQAFN